MEAQAKYEVTAPLDIQELTDANLEAMREELLFIPAVPETKEQYLVAKTINISVKKILPRIEERRKEIKAPHLEKCREIDALAKDAVALVQPIIDMSAERRQAWEAEVEAQKEAERAAEQARLDDIINAIEDLKEMVRACTEYGVDAKSIESNMQTLFHAEISPEIYQEHIEAAQEIKSNGLLMAESCLENRLAFEEEQAELEAQKKAQAEAQAKIDAANKAEAERLAKIEADQKAAAAKAQAEIDAKNKLEADRLAKIQEEQDKAAREARDAQEEAARKLEADRKAFEEHKKQAEKAEADRVEAARIAERDRLWAEALPIHIWEHVYPAALSANKLFDEIRDQQLSAQAKRNMDVLRNRNAIENMVRNVFDAIEMARDGIDMPELKSFVNDFERAIKAAETNLNQSIAMFVGVK